MSQENLKRRKPHLSFWQIWNMSFGFLGIQFGYGLQNANVSRIFETLGAKVEDIPILWIAAPITGLIVQPIIGHMSDKTWTRLGRRKPFFLFGAILTTLALLFMPYSPALWIAAGMLWIMDASINISMEPFRAFVGDMLPSEQRTTGFAMQSFFIGAGAVIASALPYMLTNWFGISNTAEAGLVPASLKWSFAIGAVVLFASVLWTIFTTKEYSPEDLAAFTEAEAEHKPVEVTEERKRVKFLLPGILFLVVGAILTVLVLLFKLEKELLIVTGGLTVFGLIMLLCALLDKSGKRKNGLMEIMSDLMTMPKTMGQLAVVQFFTWFAFFSLWTYTTPAVTSRLYSSDPTSALYNQGADWVGILFGVYNAVAAASAFLLPWIARHTSRKITHSICLAIGGISFIAFFLVNDPIMLILPMVGVGIAWAGTLSMPYAILTGALPSNKMGTYMGIFNFFIVIPQILAASVLGFLMKQFFNSEAVYALILGGISLLIAAVCIFFVDDKDDRR